MTVITRAYHARDAEAFRNLNLAWIERFFEVEITDREQLSDPDAYFLAKGGHIIIAENDQQAVGTVALVPLSDTRMELCKMAVDPGAQGQGVGAALITQALETAKAMGANEVWLETNSALAPAIRLYERAGFRHLSADELSDTPYSRCNVQMLKSVS